MRFEHASGDTVNVNNGTTQHAESIAYTTLGQSGIHFERVAKRLGIAEQLKPKYKLILGGLVGELVVNGNAKMGVQMLSEILAVPGFETI